MRFEILTIAGMIMLSTPLPAPASLTVRDIIENNTQARGGKQALEAIERLEYELVIEEPGFTVDAIYRIERGKGVRIDIFDDGRRVFSEGHDSNSAWQWPAGEAHGKPTNKAGAAALLHGLQLPIHLNGLHQMNAQGHLVGYLGIKPFNGKETHALKIVLKDHTEVYYFLDPETWQIIGNRDFRAFHPDLDPEKKQLETRFSDFREVGGVTRAFVTENYDLQSGERVGRTVIKSVKVNPEFADDIFKQP